MPSLVKTWCSRASMIQRQGRTGRLSPGTVIRMMPRKFFDTLPEFDSAEMTRIPLQQVVLRVMLLLRPFGSLKELLAATIESPDMRDIEIAIRMLYEGAAITEESEDARVT